MRVQISSLRPYQTMPHLTNLGRCALCRKEVISKFGMKEHVMGDVAKNDLIGWTEGKDLSAS